MNTDGEAGVRGTQWQLGSQTDSGLLKLRKREGLAMAQWVDPSLHHRHQGNRDTEQSSSDPDRARRICAKSSRDADPDSLPQHGGIEHSNHFSFLVSIFNITDNQGICFVELLWKAKGYIDLNMSIGCADSWAAALCRPQTVVLPFSASHTSFCQLEPELTSVFLCLFCFCSLPLPFLLVSLSVVSSWWPQCLASNSGSLCKAFCWLYPKCLVP